MIAMIESGVSNLGSVPGSLKRVLISEWDRLDWSFQMFLAEHGLSSHVWLAARRHA
jgi:hypothetical protein